MAHSPSAEYVTSYQKKMALAVQYTSSHAYLVRSKTVVQFDHPDIVPTRARLSKQRICQAARHPIADRVHRTPTVKRARNVRPEPDSDHLDRLVFELVGAHERLVRDDAARSTILHAHSTEFQKS